MKATADKLPSFIAWFNTACRRPMPYEQLKELLRSNDTCFEVVSGKDLIPFDEMGAPDQKQYSGTYALRFRNPSKYGKNISLVGTFDAIISASVEITHERDEIGEPYTEYHNSVNLIHISTIKFCYNEMMCWEQNADIHIQDIIKRKIMIYI